MHALPFFVALLVAAIMAPMVLRWLASAGHRHRNYRGRELPYPFGVLSVVGALVALVPLALLQELGDTSVFYPGGTMRIVMYVLGVAVLGLIDDTLEASQPRGWRGHGGALLRGELSTGTFKAIGSLGLALFALSGGVLSSGRYLVAAVVLVLSTNLFNLLDLRPGRATKAFVLLGVGLTVGAAEARLLWALGLFAGPALVAGIYDLRERAMLGDTGANLLGALAGWWVVLALDVTGQTIALALLVLITIYGEFRSISALVEKTPGLRQLDSLGRPS